MPNETEEKEKIVDELDAEQEPELKANYGSLLSGIMEDKDEADEDEDLEDMVNEASAAYEAELDLAPDIPELNNAAAPSEEDPYLEESQLSKLQDTESLQSEQAEQQDQPAANENGQNNNGQQHNPQEAATYPGHHVPAGSGVMGLFSRLMGRRHEPSEQYGESVDCPYRQKALNNYFHKRQALDDHALSCMDHLTDLNNSQTGKIRDELKASGAEPSPDTIKGSFAMDDEAKVAWKSFGQELKEFEKSSLELERFAKSAGIDPADSGDFIENRLNRINEKADKALDGLTDERGNSLKEKLDMMMERVDKALESLRNMLASMFGKSSGPTLE